jgi:hypothetical protein
VTEAANPLATAPTARCVEKFATPVSRLDEADDRRFVSAERRSREFDHRHLQMLAQKLNGQIRFELSQASHVSGQGRTLVTIATDQGRPTCFLVASPLSSLFRSGNSNFIVA